MAHRFGYFRLLPQHGIPEVDAKVLRLPAGECRLQSRRLVAFHEWKREHQKGGRRSERNRQAPGSPTIDLLESHLRAEVPELRPAGSADAWDEVEAELAVGEGLEVTLRRVQTQDPVRRQCHQLVGEDTGAKR